jgi:hypothetical protein
MINLLRKIFGKISGCCVIPNKNDGLTNGVQKPYVQQQAYNPK